MFFWNEDILIETSLRGKKTKAAERDADPAVKHCGFFAFGFLVAVPERWF
jgi:hypothetical protein